MQFINTYAKLDEIFYERISPSGFSKPELFLWNEPLAKELNIPNNLQQDREKLGRVFAGNELLNGFSPIALAYAGHQYGNFVPELGDGRAHLLGEILDQEGIGRDIQLKGSGQTRFSRRGDGLCAMGPAIREFIMSEALYALGVPTARSLAVVTTGELVFREKPLPGAVVTRVASSHIRVGTFEYFAARENIAAIRQLVDYTIKRHYPQIDELLEQECPERVLLFLRSVMDRQIVLVAEWMRIGFVHGVMNTDNTALSGETIDFGPCAMMNHYDPNTVFSSIDMYGRYAFGNQPKIAAWNMTRLAECLLPLVNSDRAKAIEMVMPLIEEFPIHFEDAWLSMLGRKIGLQKTEATDRKLITDLLGIMTANRADYTNTMNLLTNIIARSDTSENITLGNSAKGTLADIGLSEWFTIWQSRLQRENESVEKIASLMRRHNPVVIPRNHHVEEVLAESQKTGKTDAVDRFLKVLRYPYQEMEDAKNYQDPPASHNQDYMTFCGT